MLKTSQKATKAKFNSNNRGNPNTKIAARGYSAGFSPEHKLQANSNRAAIAFAPIANCTNMRFNHSITAP